MLRSFAIAAAAIMALAAAHPAEAAGARRAEARSSGKAARVAALGERVEKTRSAAPAPVAAPVQKPGLHPSC